MVEKINSEVGWSNRMPIICGLSFILVFSAIGPVSAIGIAGSVFQADVEPGDTLSHDIVITSSENDPALNLAAELRGFGQDTQASYLGVNAEDDTGGYSAREFLTIEPTSFSLEPGASQALHLTGTVPLNVGVGGRYAIVDIITRPPESSDEPSKLTTSVGFSALIFLSIPDDDKPNRGFIKEGEIEEVDYVDFGSEETGPNWGVSVLFKNTGNYHYKVSLDGALKDEHGTELTTFSKPLGMSYILPGNSMRINSSLSLEEELAPGTYSIETAVSLEDGTELASDETTLTV